VLIRLPSEFILKTEGPSLDSAIRECSPSGNKNESVIGSVKEKGKTIGQSIVAAAILIETGYSMLDRLIHFSRFLKEKDSANGRRTDETKSQALQRMIRTTHISIDFADKQPRAIQPMRSLCVFEGSQ
jgi:hypothetical protein